MFDKTEIVCYTPITQRYFFATRLTVKIVNSRFHTSFLVQISIPKRRNTMSASAHTPAHEGGINYPPGTFGWIDLASTDMEASKSFYTQLFGWEAVDTPLGDSYSYTTFLLHGKPVAGGGQLSQEQQDQGMGSVWSTCVMVEDAEATVAKAQAAGGTIIAPTMDIMEEGRLAVLQDPTGAFITLWQPKNHKGAQIANAPGAVVWNELMTPDPERAIEFYNAIFGWTAELGDGSQPNGGPQYTMFQHPTGISAAGMLTLSPDMPAPPCWMIYIGVADFDSSLEKAKSLGATPATDPIDSPFGRLIVLQDPQGAFFNIIAGTSS